MDLSGLNNKKLVDLIRQGKIGVLPTDTIYGIHASIFHPESIEKIYNLKNKDPKEATVVLISSFEDLNLLKINITREDKKFLEKVWPGKISVVLPLNNEWFSYIHRGNNSLAVRLPADSDLIEFLHETGPLVSTSASPSGENYATTIEEAENYFGDKLDFYVNAGVLKVEPSTVVELIGGKIKIIREGALKLTK